ncbi:hypothetical protein LKD70_11230 [Ruminococcus sp. CLA-AA-H200]|uniref:Uncharacterized protein n=2 Tax=Ruminococcus turbiniformis TaxID=2881258 RepID=A0ABS8FY63_9FIRM|nr:hypothetical protein [Ruminococcus turbiniformis]
MKKHNIRDYMELICSLLIDQFNVRYREYSQEKFKEEADVRYVERDWIYKLGEPFKDLAYYEIQNEKSSQVHHDIGIPSKDFIMEVKYLKNWDSTSKTKTAKKIWKEFEKDLTWLEEEIRTGNKGKRAFIIIWCNCIDYFGRVVQLGSGHGVKNPVNKDRLVYFPFLMNKNQDPEKMYTKDLVYNYEKRFPCLLDLNSIGKGDVEMDCLFLGKREDRLHIVIYY